MKRLLERLWGPNQQMHMIGHYTIAKQKVIAVRLQLMQLGFENGRNPGCSQPVWALYRVVQCIIPLPKIPFADIRKHLGIAIESGMFGSQPLQSQSGYYFCRQRACQPKRNE